MQGSRQGIQLAPSTPEPTSTGEKGAGLLEPPETLKKTMPLKDLKPRECRGLVEGMKSLADEERFTH